MLAPPDIVSELVRGLLVYQLVSIPMTGDLMPRFGDPTDKSWVLLCHEPQNKEGCRGVGPFQYFQVYLGVFLYGRLYGSVVFK